MNDDHSSKLRLWLEPIASLLRQKPKNKEQLMKILREAEERHLLSGEMLSMIESVIRVSEMQVREIMIPKVQMVSLNQNTNLEKLLPMIIESGHSRFPIFDETGNDVIGIVLAKDLLTYSSKQAPFNMSDVMRPATFVPLSKRLDILLREFRSNRNHMAIVVDEYGHVAGLITIEDVLEQIVGEIEDEYDIDEEDYIKKHKDSYTVKAMTPIDEFNDYFHTDFGDEEFDTIGGLLLKKFGHLPKRGEGLTIKNYIFKILHSDKRRIHLLEVRKVMLTETN